MSKNKKSLDELMESRKSSVIEGDHGPILIKTATAPPSFKKDDEGNRSATFVMSSEATDRDRDIVRINGIELDDFEKNPIALWMHNHRSPAIGTWDDLKKVGGSKKRLEGTLSFVPEGAVNQADEISKLVELGIYRACSIGFSIKDYERIMDDDDNWTYGYDFVSTSLHECSVVAVGANSQALVKAADMNKTFVIDTIEDILDNWQKTPSGLIVPRDQFEEAYELVAGDKTIVAGLSEYALNPPQEVVEEDDKTTEKMVIEVDTAQAEEKLNGLSKLVDGLIGKAKTLAGMVQPPEPEYVDGSLDRAKAIREKLQNSKHLAAE